MYTASEISGGASQRAIAAARHCRPLPKQQKNTATGFKHRPGRCFKDESSRVMKGLHFLLICLGFVYPHFSAQYESFGIAATGVVLSLPAGMEYSHLHLLKSWAGK